MRRKSSGDECARTLGWPRLVSGPCCVIDVYKKVESFAFDHICWEETKSGPFCKAVIVTIVNIVSIVSYGIYHHYIFISIIIMHLHCAREILTTENARVMEIESDPWSYHTWLMIYAFFTHHFLHFYMPVKLSWNCILYLCEGRIYCSWHTLRY